MYAEIYIQAKGEQALKEFSDAVCTKLGLANPQERDSVHHPTGVYYRAIALGLKLDIDVADDHQVADYDFCISVSPHYAKDVEATVLEGLADLIAIELTRREYAALRLSRDVSSSGMPKTRRRCVLEVDGPRFIKD